MTAESAPLAANRARSGFMSVPWLHYVMLFSVVGIWGFLVYQLWTLEAQACRDLPSETPGLRLVGASVLGLLIGRYAGVFRFDSSWRTFDPETNRRQLADTGRFALAFLFLTLVFIFVYEAIGVYEPKNGLEPITYYVRCSIRLDNEFGGGWRTFAIVSAISFLFGHWLWASHRIEQPLRGRMRKATGELVDRLARRTFSER
jgi:hypothetical protein